MKIWREFYNEETKLIEMEEDNTDGKYPYTNLYDAQHSYFTNITDATNGMNHANEDIAKGKLFVRQCKECGMFYYANKDEDEWFLDRNLKIPKRCPKCRRHKK